MSFNRSFNPTVPMARQSSGERSRSRERRALSKVARDVAALLSSSPWSSRNARGCLDCRRSHVSKEVLLGIGVVTTAFQGGGLIFGFSAFATKVTGLPNSPFSKTNVSTIFAIGHNITAWGCIVSGLVLDKFGPRFTVTSGLLVEALGHFILLHIYDVPSWLVPVGFGMLGIGGCQVLLAALSFADAFRNAAFTNSMITAAFQAGGFIFMVLPFVDWSVFFECYALFCLGGVVVTGLLYPDSSLPTYSPDRDDCSEIAEMSAAVASSGSLMSILLRPGTLWFLATFCVAGSAFTYGYGEFVVAIHSKDACHINSQGIEECAKQDLQDLFNNFLLPLLGNFIFPSALLLGWIIDKKGFAPAAFINIFFVQAFLLCLWLLPIEMQYITLVVYNLANTSVFTVQNAYICAVGHSHIGALFGISNFVLGAGNLLADYLTLNPFGSEDKVNDSLFMSCVLWLVLCTPLYYWVFVEIRHFRITRRGLQEVESAASSFSSQERRRSHGDLEESSCCADQRAAGQEPQEAAMKGADMRDSSPLLQGQACPRDFRDLETSMQGALNSLTTSVHRISSRELSDMSAAAAPLPRIECNLVITVNQQAWDRKVQRVLEAGADKVFCVLDFDRTVTKCFLEDGSRSLDCHDILASIDKITRECRRKMEGMMEKYYPIEIHPTMTREEKIPHMVEWYHLVNDLLAAQNITRDDVATAVAGCKHFRLRSGIEEVFGIAQRRGIPIVIVSAGLGNVIEEVIRQYIRTPNGTTAERWDNVRVLGNTLQWDANGNHTGYSEPLIHMYNKSLQDAPDDLRDLIKGRHVGILCGDGTGDLTMAHGHDTSEVLKVGFLNEKAEERLPKYTGVNCYDRVVLFDGTFEPVLEVQKVQFTILTLAAPAQMQELASTSKEVLRRL